MGPTPPRSGWGFSLRSSPSPCWPVPPCTVRRMTDNASPQPSPAAAVEVERIPLVRLAAQSSVPSAALNRVVSNGVVQRGPGRVAVAAFQSSV